MPSAIPVGWFATTIAAPWRGMCSSPSTSTWRPIISASASMMWADGSGSIAWPIFTVRSYWRIACSSGRTTAVPGPRRRSQGARSSISWSRTSRIMPPSYRGSLISS